MLLQMINQKQLRKVPNHLPKIKPPTKKLGDPKPKKEPKELYLKKNNILDKNILLFLISSKVSLFLLKLIHNL